MDKVFWRFLINCPLVCVASFLMACVGPTTPFGTTDTSAVVDESRQPAEAAGIQNYQIKFHPEKQVLHDRSDFSIEVIADQPIDASIQLQITHNGFDVTQSFLKNSNLHKSSDYKTWIYTLNNFRLKTLDLNDIEVKLIKSGRYVSSHKFEQPNCSLFEKSKIAHLGAFHPPKNYIELIERVSASKQANPNFLAGIVAQESGFNPKAVSWAKAIGLTQITPLAEKQLINSVKEWPRYPGINSLSYVTLKTKIKMGEITDGKEWRLNPEKSLIGGLSYVDYLKKYWSLEQNSKIIDSLNGDRDQVLTEVILASYNSGAARVKRAIIEKNGDWQKHSSLKEAVKYLKKVSSYCFHYADKENEDDS